MSHFHVATACQLFIFTFIFNFLLQFIYIQFAHIFENKTITYYINFGDSLSTETKNCCLKPLVKIMVIYDKVIQQKIVTKQDCKMGCTDSSAVVDNTHKLKPLTVSIDKIDSDNILMGEIDEQKFISVNVIVRQHEEEPIIIQERSLPTLIDKQGQSQKSKLPNFGQLVRINASGLYILTGGISYKLDHIYNETYLFNSKTNKLFKLAQLRQARYTHSTVIYQDKVYVIGGRYFGQDDKAILNKCQYLKLNIKANSNLLEQQLQSLILKNQDQWQQLPNMSIKRCSHISILYNKRIYVVGGYTGQYQRSTVIEYLNVQTNQWNILPFQLPYGLQSCTTLSVQPNRVIIFGGNSNSGSIDSAMQLCLLSGSEGAKARSKLKRKRVLHKLFQNGNNAWLLGGNQNMDMQLYQLTEQNSHQQQKIKQKKSKKIKNPLLTHFSNQSIFQSLTQTLVTLSPAYNAQPSSRPSAQKSDQIAVIFGTDTEPFILQLNISVPYAYCHSMPLSIKLFALQGVIYLPESDEYLLYGGISDSQEQVSSQTFVFNLKDFSKSRKIGNMNIARYAFGSRRIGDWIYAIGGGAADQQGQLMIINKCERLNIKSIPKINEKKEVKWEQIANLPIGLISPMSINHKNRLYIFGGMKQNKQRYQNILRLSESGSAWEQISYKFPFGLEASSIYHKSESQYLIFGGRVVNGDTPNIWALTFINNGDDCVFEQKGKMKQAKCLHHVYKPKHQNFVVVLGGEKQVLSFYDSDSLKPIQSDILTGLKQLFVENLGSLSDKSLKNYTMAIKE